MPWVLLATTLTFVVVAAALVAGALGARARMRAQYETTEVVRSIERRMDMYLALLRALEVIGEAASRVSQPLRDGHPEVPWAQIVALRNRLIHGYDAVDADRLWQILTSDVPKLITDLQRILA